jgi:integrase
VALSARGAAALDAIPDVDTYYFHSLRGATMERDRRSMVRRRLVKLCKKAHVKYGRKQGGLTFHWATRRTGATRMLLKKGVPLSAVQRQGTWKNPDVLLQIYAEAGRADMRKAVAPFPLPSRARRKRA